MTIQQGDIKIMASQVLADVPEGGGAATGAEVIDGQSNNLFPDISELDRTVGRVNLRKIFPAIRTLSNDGYYGVNAIISDPPDDPAVSAVLFHTGEYFDTRSSAQVRLESYLTRGPQYGGLLFGDHIAGMRTVTMLQRASVAVPSIGTTLYLRANAGQSTEHSQYVRITQVSSRDREFAVPGSGEKTFHRTEVTIELSDPLREDYAGFTPKDSYEDSTVSYVGKTELFETIVADAAQYFGIVPLAADVSIGDFSADVETIFSQVVPSAQVETPIADARMNQQTAAIVPTSGTITQSMTLGFSPAQSLYIGGGVSPGTLSVVRDGVTMTDRGGKLVVNGANVGLIDYANGILALSTTVWATAGTHVITYAPTSTIETVTRSIGVPVTQQSQSLTQVVTLDPIPAPASLQISYLSGGRWYVLQETGTGSITGADSSLGAGSLNSSTGTVQLTMGALPDIGSQVIYSWAPIQDRGSIASSQLDNAARAYFDIAIGSFEPGSLAMAWNDGAAKTASDSAGALIGDAAGKCWYGSGRLQFSPLAMPPAGTTLTWTVTAATQRTESVSSWSDTGSTLTATLHGAPIKPRSIRLAVAASYPVRVYPEDSATEYAILPLQDDGSGAIYVNHQTGTLNVGTINYTTGAISITKTVNGYVMAQPLWERKTPSGSGSSDPAYITYMGNTNRTIDLTMRDSLADVAEPIPSWAWWTSYTSEKGFAQYATASGAVTTGSAQLSTALTASSMFRAGLDIFGYAWGAVTFKLGSSTYVSRGTTIIKDPLPTTGEGASVGYLSGLSASFSAWPAGASSLLTDLTGIKTPAALSRQDVFVDGVIFRTAQAPIKPASFSVTGKLRDGTSFSATADLDGNLITTHCKGHINAETGVVVLRFGQATSAPADTNNPGAKINLSYLGISGLSWVIPETVQADTLRYNAVAYSYIPLDADILGLDPVRLPSDGRVAVFRPGVVAVVHNTQTTSPATVSNGQTLSTGRTRLARVRVIGANGQTISSGYSHDLDAGTVTFSNVSGYSQPVRIEHRIEDAALVREAQITGRLSLTRAISHAYPAAGSYVSSALLIGDMQSRVSSVYDQGTWTNVWSDDLIGDQANATFNTIDHPITSNNLGAVTERFVLQFTGTTSFRCIGEHLGVLGTGNTSETFSPTNPATGQPYFTVPALGWGSGWSSGNCLRINTVGALAPIWVARVIKQSQPSTQSDSFSILIRGDIDNPA